mmetsp:Transcript_25434/g.70873  ORF Transcript_25434/g.70873 Transcript_25434/m.70873 type:complete len:344 (+) Transcript_25434:1623-2654(+)
MTASNTRKADPRGHQQKAAECGEIPVRGVLARPATGQSWAWRRRIGRSSTTRMAGGTTSTDPAAGHSGTRRRSSGATATGRAAQPARRTGRSWRTRGAAASTTTRRVAARSGTHLPHKARGQRWAVTLGAGEGWRRRAPHWRAEETLCGASGGMTGATEDPMRRRRVHSPLVRIGPVRARARMLGKRSRRSSARTLRAAGARSGGRRAMTWSGAAVLGRGRRPFFPLGEGPRRRTGARRATRWPPAAKAATGAAQARALSAAIRRGPRTRPGRAARVSGVARTGASRTAGRTGRLLGTWRRRLETLPRRAMLMLRQETLSRMACIRIGRNARTTTATCTTTTP